MSKLLLYCSEMLKFVIYTMYVTKVQLRVRLTKFDNFSSSCCCCSSFLILDYCLLFSQQFHDVSINKDCQLSIYLSFGLPGCCFLVGIISRAILISLSSPALLMQLFYSNLLFLINSPISSISQSSPTIWFLTLSIRICCSIVPNVLIYS